MDAVARSVGRARGHRSLLDRLLGREPAPPGIPEGPLWDRGDDVSRALRF